MANKPIKGVDIEYPANDGTRKKITTGDTGEAEANDVQVGEKREMVVAIGEQSAKFQVDVKPGEKIPLAISFADDVAREAIALLQANKMPFPAEKPLSRMLLTVDENFKIGMTEQTGNIATYEYQFKIKKGKSISFTNPAFKGYIIDPTILAETTSETNFFRMCRMGRIKNMKGEIVPNAADFDVFFGNDNQVNIDSNYEDDAGEQECNVKLILQVVKTIVKKPTANSFKVVFDINVTEPDRFRLFVMPYPQIPGNTVWRDMELTTLGQQQIETPFLLIGVEKYQAFIYDYKAQRIVATQDVVPKGGEIYTISYNSEK